MAQAEKQDCTQEIRNLGLHIQRLNECLGQHKEDNGRNTPVIEDPTGWESSDSEVDRSVRNKKNLPRAVAESTESDTTDKRTSRQAEIDNEKYSNEYWWAAMEEHRKIMSNSEKASSVKPPNQPTDPTLAKLIQQAIRKAIKLAKQLRRPKTNVRQERQSEPSQQQAIQQQAPAQDT